MVLPLLARVAAGSAVRGGGGSSKPPSLPRLELSVKDDVDEFVKRLNNIQRKQIPFATAISLTKTAQAGQKNVQGVIPHHFKVTKRWWLKQQPTGIKIIPATKFRLVATVYTNAHFAELQEEGGTKRPFKSGKIAIPSVNVKTRKLRKSGGARDATGRNKVFFTKLKSGKSAIFRRKGKKRGTAELMYTLDTKAQVKRRFGFKKVLRKSVQKNFKRIFAMQLTKALRSARR